MTFRCIRTALRRSATPVLAAGLLTGTMAAAPTWLAAQELPAAEQLIARHVEAIGGREAVLRPRVSRATGTFEMAAAGLKGDLTIITEAPNRMVSIVTIPTVGDMRSGFDGQIGWSVDPLAGARLLTGAELDAMRENADARAAVRDASLFRSISTVERTESAGEACYRVRLEWQSGRVTYDCYHVDSGLLIETSAEAETPMGAIAVTTTLAEYQAFGDVLVATRTTLSMMGAQQVLTIANVEFDDVDTAPIDPPEAINTLRAGGA